MIYEIFPTLPVDPNLFRMYDIRGIVNESLTPEVIYFIGKVFGSLVQEKGGTQLVLARDGRLSSAALSIALRDGVLSSGCNVINLGLAPTPLLYYATHLLSDHAGLMLTGSHNPPDYNGIKMVLENRCLAAEEIQHIYQRLIHREFKNGKGQISAWHLQDQYLSHISRYINLTKPLKIVIDAGNGVAGNLAPILYRHLGCEVDELFCEVDGQFPNHEADPSQIKNLESLMARVKEIKADVGLAFDGDGDRLGIVTNQGNIIWPDRLMMLFAKSILTSHPRAKIIFDVKCTDRLAKLISSLGGQPILWKTGHSLIKAKMLAEDAALAGEMSGHFFFKDWFGFDDALYAGARFLDILANEQTSCDALFADIPDTINTPEIKVNVTEEEKFSLMNSLEKTVDLSDDKEIISIDGMRVQFKNGWGLIRPSNTTPNLILRFEAASHEALTEIQHFFRQWMQTVKPGWVLPF